MLNRLVTFNTLPPKPAHITSVKRIMAEYKNISLDVLLAKTGLTKTQAMCVLNMLLKDGLVRKLSKKYIFIWTSSTDDD